MLGFVKNWCGCVLCSVRATPHDQSPLAGTRSGVLEEVVQQDLQSVRIYGIPRPAKHTSLNSRPLLSYNVLERVVIQFQLYLRQDSHDYALPQPLLELLPGFLITNKDAWVRLHQGCFGR